MLNKELYQNLCEITVVATEQFKNGILPSKVFGKQHKIDGPKFVETSIVFAVASMLNGSEKPD